MQTSKIFHTARSLSREYMHSVATCINTAAWNINYTIAGMPLRLPYRNLLCQRDSKLFHPLSFKVSNTVAPFKRKISQTNYTIKTKDERNRCELHSPSTVMTYEMSHIYLYTIRTQVNVEYASLRCIFIANCCISKN